MVPRATMFRFGALKTCGSHGGSNLISGVSSYGFIASRAFRRWTKLYQMRLSRKVRSLVEELGGAILLHLTLSSPYFCSTATMR